MFKRIGLQITVVMFFILASCSRPGPVVLPDVQDISPTAKATEVFPTRSAEPSTPIPVEFTETSSPLPEVTVTAIKGNLFIRRGPDMAYNPVGVLYKGASAKVIAQDVLSDWVQIVIPDSGNTGWVSVQTQYSRVEGDLGSLPGLTQTEWPIPAYLRNCTAHEMYILPGEIHLPSYLAFPENETWLYPGSYTVYDLDVADYPEVMSVEIREGSDEEIKVDGTGDKHGCP